MDEPRCTDGTTEHTWVADPATKISDVRYVLQCMVCGAKAIAAQRDDGQYELRFARPPRWGFKGLPPDDERPRMPPQPTEPPPVELPPIDMRHWKQRRGRE